MAAAQLKALCAIKSKESRSMADHRYDERYCLFLDILGFQSHIDETVSPKSTGSSKMSFNSLRAALKEIYDGVHYKEGYIEGGMAIPTSRKVAQFSDSIIVSYLKNEQNGSGVSSIIMDVHKLQCKMVQRGILMRGAITTGLLYHDDAFVFGPALNEAVALEKLASYPRVIIDGEILNEAGLRKNPGHEHFRSISSMVTEDFDGLYYVDYFNVHPDDFSDDWSDLSNYLSKLREIIKELSAKKTPSIKVKHSWMRTKFNKMAMPFQKSGFARLGVRSVPEEDIEIFTHIKPF